LDLYCLKPGQAQRIHAHPDSDKVYYVLGGRATVRVDSEEGELRAGQAVLAPCGAEHGVANRTEEPVTLLVFMAPRPAH
jgi:mannose-6-phosphate isomerase-like protein (cupin superfamily)